MASFFIPKHAKETLYWLAEEDTDIYLVGKGSSTHQKWVNFTVKDSGGYQGVIHLHDTKGDVRAVRYKTSGSSEYGTNVIVRDQDETRKFYVGSITIKQFWKDAGLSRAALRLLKKLKGAKQEET